MSQFGCDNIESLLKDCGNPIGGIHPTIYIQDSSLIEDADFQYNLSAHTITGITVTGVTFETIEFRKNLATLNEDYTMAEDGPEIYVPTLVIPIMGRDALKSKKITLMGAGQRELDIIVKQNNGGYVYLRKMQLRSVADGTGANKNEASKYTLTFDGQAEHLSYFVEESVVNGLV
jgi:hypothetical protein